MRRRVKCPAVHPTAGASYEPLGASEHFLGGATGKCEDENSLWPDAAFNEVRDAADERTSFSRPRAGNDEKRAVGVRRSAGLRFVELTGERVRVPRLHFAGPLWVDARVVRHSRNIANGDLPSPSRVPRCDIVRVNNIKRSLFERDPRSIALVVLAVGMLLRFVLAASVGLGVDESYAVAVARQWSWSYFDHPPLHFWLAGAIAKLAASESGAVVRLPFVLCFAGTTWLTYRIGSRFFGERSGALAAVILNVSAVFSLSTGGWVLPDGPLMLLMLAAVYVISGILFEEQRHSGPLGDWPVTMRWLTAGLITGLAMLAKYHGIFVLAGTFLFLLTSAPHRKWLRHPGPYLGTFVAFACFTPVLFWNSEHQWVSFAFQGGRATGQGIHLPAMLTNIAGQAAWVLPWIWLPLVVVLWSAIRGGPRDAARWFFVCLGLGPIAAFTLIALHGDVGLPHWQAPGYLMLFPLLGAAVATRIEQRDRITQRWLSASIVGYVALVLILVTHAATGWLGRVVPSAFAKGDPSSDLRTWSALRPALDSLGLLTPGGFVAAPSWIQAGEASVALGPDIPVLCLCSDPHHFYYLQDDRAFLGHDALIVKKLRPGDNVASLFAPYFDSIETVAMVPVLRNHRALFEIGVYRARHFRALYPTAQPR